MEQARYWMWEKRKHNSLSSSSHLDYHHLQVPITNPSIDYASWEEKAFAEDAAGPLGGCVWPPRSYSCSFCRREFRSAQALGGHMNVHRRDRARLKQSPNDETALKNHHLVQDGPNPFGSSFQFPSRQVCALIYSNNNPKASTSPPSPTSRVSGLSAQLPPCKETCADHQQTLIPPPSSSSASSPGQSWSTFSKNRWYNDNSNKSVKRNVVEAEKISRAVESRPRAKAKGDHNLSVSLNMVVRCNRPSLVSDSDDEQHEAVISCKRRRLSDKADVVPSSIPFFLKSDSVERVQRHELQSAQGTLELGRIGSIEELDLELRLGDRPDKVIKVDK